MTTKTNLLASGKAARLVFGAVAATALTAASATPAMADDRRDRGGIGAGEISASLEMDGSVTSAPASIAYSIASRAPQE